MTEEEINLIYQTLCSRIKSKRLSKCITGEDMADALGMTRANYSNIENGKQHILFHHVVKICQILRMKVVE